jgi:hypothetical protein
MTAIYTYSEARQNFASLLDLAASEGEVRIQRRDGQTFVLRPEQISKSPLDIEGVDLDLGVDEILESIQEGRRLYEPRLK